jgi:hypothetical protein
MKLFWIWEWSIGAYHFFVGKAQAPAYFGDYDAVEEGYWGIQEILRLARLGFYLVIIILLLRRNFGEMCLYHERLAGWVRQWFYSSFPPVIHNHWSSKIEDRQLFRTPTTKRF